MQEIVKPDKDNIDTMAIATAIELVVLLRDNDMPHTICRYIGVDIDDYYMAIGALYTVLRQYIATI